jgi:hypothetical protein
VAAVGRWRQAGHSVKRLKFLVVPETALSALNSAWFVPKKAS